MKKLLWILSILLVFALGFLYIVKNPQLPISQTVLGTLGIEMSTGAQSTGVDLSGCVSYFDGCNTCMVSGGVLGGCTKMFCQTPAEPQCLEYASTGTVDTGALADTGMSGDIVQNGTTKTYSNLQYGLSFSYPAARELHTQESAITEDCSLRLTITLIDPSKPLQCFDAGCTPNIQPSLGIYIWNARNCQRMKTTCSSLETGLQNVCQQLISMGMSEAKAASTVSFGGNNGTDYSVITGTYEHIFKGTFIDGIVTQSRAFVLNDSGYAVQIFDNEGMYTDVFDTFISTFSYH